MPQVATPCCKTEQYLQSAQQFASLLRPSQSVTQLESQFTTGSSQTNIAANTLPKSCQELQPHEPTSCTWWPKSFWCQQPWFNHQPSWIHDLHWETMPKLRLANQHSAHMLEKCPTQNGATWKPWTKIMEKILQQEICHRTKVKLCFKTVQVRVYRTSKPMGKCTVKSRNYATQNKTKPAKQILDLQTAA